MLLKRFNTLLLISSLLSSCVTTQHGKGVIIAEEKIATHIYKSHTKDNLVTVAGSGAIMGTSLLLLIFAAGGNLAASESLVMIGAATGYGLLAGVGGVTVLELYRYMTQKSQKDHELYRLTVKSLTEADKTFVVEQNYPRYPLNTKVTIFEKGGSLFIRKR